MMAYGRGPSTIQTVSASGTTDGRSISTIPNEANASRIGLAIEGGWLASFIQSATPPDIARGEDAGSSYIAVVPKPARLSVLALSRPNSPCSASWAITVTWPFGAFFKRAIISVLSSGKITRWSRFASSSRRVRLPFLILRLFHSLGLYHVERAPFRRHGVGFTSPTSLGISHVVAFLCLTVCLCEAAASFYGSTLTKLDRSRCRHAPHSPSACHEALQKTGKPQRKYRL